MGPGLSTLTQNINKSQSQPESKPEPHQLPPVVSNEPQSIETPDIKEALQILFDESFKK